VWSVHSIRELKRVGCAGKTVISLSTRAIALPQGFWGEIITARHFRVGQIKRGYTFKLITLEMLSLVGSPPFFGRKEGRLSLNMTT